MNKVWYDIKLHFGCRGKEGNQDLKPDSFILKRDENGAKYFIVTFKQKFIKVHWRHRKSEGRYV